MKRPMIASSALAACSLLLVACAGTDARPDDGAPVWQPLFDGVSLDGWTPKFAGYPLGENYRDTFRVEDGLLRVTYADWDEFRGEFGHLFFAEPLSHYRLRVEYRFVGDQTPGAPGWAVRNSGVMLHGQDPTTMALDQDFPVSIEAQLLGGDGVHERSTANLCTPGTNVEMDGELVTRHCTNSDSATYHGDGWVTVELEVRGGEVIRHFVEGREVLAYQHPQLDPRDPDAPHLVAARGGADADLVLTGGTISLQAEGHALDFRRVDVLLLDQD